MSCNLSRNSLENVVRLVSSSVLCASVVSIFGYITAVNLVMVIFQQNETWAFSRITGKLAWSYAMQSFRSLLSIEYGRILYQGKVTGASLPQYIADVKIVWKPTFTPPYAFFLLDRFLTERIVSFELREGKEENTALGVNDIVLRAFCTIFFPQIIRFLVFLVLYQGAPMKLRKNISKNARAGDKLHFINLALWKYEPKIVQ